MAGTAWTPATEALLARLWTEDHLPLVWSGARTAGGVSRADVERDHPATRVA